MWVQTAERDKEGRDLILPRVPVAMSATFWKASRNELVTMIVVLNDRKRKSLSVRKTYKQSGLDWILANSRYITTNISTDRFMELAPGRDVNSTAAHNTLED